MQLLAENNAAVIFCDAKHLPNSMLLHLDAHYIQNERFKAQIQASEPLKKQLWQQTIVAKIKNQGQLLNYLAKDGKALLMKAKLVKSGDTTQEEAKAARIYWQRLFGSDFTRARFGVAPNAGLNYAYAILRAAMARALAGSGLLNTLGIHHHNRYNAFCLADDLMEPYRPFVDLCVYELVEAGENLESLNTQVKAELLKILNQDVALNNEVKPLQNALKVTAQSLAKCFEGKSKKLHFPSLTK
jgi:CRISPR-associated protein Cas1